MVDTSFKQKMDTQVQPSIDWIKAQIAAINNEMANLQTHTLQAMKNQKEENTKIIEKQNIILSYALLDKGLHVISYQN